MATVEELKAQAYDALIQMEKWKMELRRLEKEISKLEEKSE